MNKDYYDGTKILSLNDLFGNKPEIYIITSNRTAGKTTYFSRYLINRFKKYGEKFMLLYRYKYELDNVADKFFKDIKELFFSEDTLTSKPFEKGVYTRLYLNGTECGYATAINCANTIKKLSHFFSDVERMMFDEFMPEDSEYAPKEIDKFQSIHTSVARGQGKHSRYVPVFLVGNTVTLLNPYYIKFGVSARLTSQTKFLRGDGWVLEQGYIDSASRAQKASGFNRAFGDDNYAKYSAEGIYLNDNLAFLEKPNTPMTRYICTIRYNGKDFGIKEYRNSGFIYVDDKPDLTNGQRIAVTNDDHSINYIMLKSSDLTISNIRYYYNHGAIRFKDLLCKEAVMVMLANRV